MTNRPVPGGTEADAIMTRWKVLAANHAGTELGDALGDAVELLAAKRELLHHSRNETNRISCCLHLASRLVYGPIPPPPALIGKALRDTFLENERVILDGGLLSLVKRLRGCRGVPQ